MKRIAPLFTVALSFVLYCSSLTAADPAKVQSVLREGGYKVQSQLAFTRLMTELENLDAPQLNALAQGLKNSKDAAKENSKQLEKWAQEGGDPRKLVQFIAQLQMKPGLALPQPRVQQVPAPVDTLADQRDFFYRYTPQTKEGKQYFAELSTKDSTPARAQREILGRLLHTAQVKTSRYCKTPPRRELVIKKDPQGKPVVPEQKVWVNLEPEISVRATKVVEIWAVKYLSKNEGDPQRAAETMERALEGFDLFGISQDSPQAGEEQVRHDTYLMIAGLEKLLALDTKSVHHSMSDRLSGK